MLRQRCEAVANALEQAAKSDSPWAKRMRERYGTQKVMDAAAHVRDLMEKGALSRMNSASIQVANIGLERSVDRLLTI